MRGKALFCLFLLLLVGVVSADTVISFANYNVNLRENTDQPWDLYHLDTGDAVIALTSSGCAGYTYASLTSPNMGYNARGLISFEYNATMLGGSTITGVKVYLYGLSGYSVLGLVNASIIDYTGSNPATTTDYKSTTFIRQCADIPMASWVVTGWNEFVLTNLSRINKTGGNTTYMFTHSADVDNTSLNWVSDQVSGFTYRPLEYSSGIYKPYIVITYIPAAGGDVTPPASVTSLAASNTTCTELNLTYTKPADVDFNHTMIYQDNVLHVNESNTTNFHKFTGLTGGTSYTFSTKTVDITGNVNTTWVNVTESATSCADTTPPASITNLVNNTTTCEQITWSWDNPLDADYNHLYVLKDNVWLGANLSNTTTASTWTSLTGGVEYAFAARTVDLTGNENMTWVNGTANSTSCVIPEIVCQNQTGNISIYFNGSTQNSIIWSWGENETLTQASLDGIFISVDFDNTTPFLEWSGFLPDTWHALKIYNGTVGEYGRLNCTTNSTPPPVWTMDINPSTERNFASESLLGYWWVLAGGIFIVWILTRRI